MAKSRVGRCTSAETVADANRRAFNRCDYELTYIDRLRTQQTAHGVRELVLLVAVGLAASESYIRDVSYRLCGGV